MTDALAQPLTLTPDVTLPNRIGKGAMSENLCGTDGAPTEGLIKLYERWGRGGAGMLLTGNVIVKPNGRTEPHNVVIEDDRHLPMLKRWADAAQAHGTKLFMQISHAGRQTMRAITWEPVAPSAVAVKRPGVFSVPRPLEDAEIEDLIQRYAFVASQAYEAGFAGVQIHGAHGYLVSQFLSPLTNLRTDRWGGSLENRMRFGVEIAKAMRKATSPTFAISAKLNSADFQRGGFSPEDSVLVAQALEAEGLNLLEISGGSYEKPAMMGAARESTRKREAYFVEYAETMRETVKMPLMVTGGFRTRAGMLEARSTGAVDVIGIARPFAVDPDLARKILDGDETRLDHGDTKVGVRLFDDLMQLWWYQEQMKRMSLGQEPTANIGKLGTLMRNLGGVSKHVIARRFSPAPS